MGLFSKKEKIPELPPATGLPQLPEIPDFPESNEKQNLPKLPSFPESPINKNLNQEIIKSAVDDSDYDNELKPSIKDAPESLEFNEDRIPHIPDYLDFAV